MWKLLILLLLPIEIIFANQPVIELSPRNFRSTLSANVLTLILFYDTPTENINSEIHKAAEILQDNKPRIPVAKINCTTYKQKCKAFNLTSNNLKIFKEFGYHSDYEGNFTAFEIADHMRGLVHPKIKFMSKLETLENLLNATKIVTVVGFFNRSTPLKWKFFEEGQILTDIILAHFSTNDENLHNSIILYRPAHLHSIFDSAFVQYNSINYPNITKFIRENYHGLVGIRTPKNEKDFKNPQVLVYYNLDIDLNPKNSNYYRNRVLRVAYDFNHRIMFSVNSKNEFRKEIVGYDISEPLVIAINQKNEKFVMETNFTMENLNIFVENFMNNSLTPYVRSAEIPKNNDGNVKVAVGKTFRKIILENDKDVLVEFYAPWCGFCRAIAPVLEELGEKLKDENVEIVKIDATINDFPDLFDVGGYPTIFWVGKGNKANPEEYNGGRNVDDFIEFIAKRSTKELRGFDREGNAKSATINEIFYDL